MGTMKIEEQLFNEIHSLFKDKETSKIFGFSFTENSAYSGYAVIRYSSSKNVKNGIGGYLIYRISDSLSKEKLVKISGQVFKYRYDNTNYIFDNLRQTLFILENDKLKSIEPIR